VSRYFDVVVVGAGPGGIAAATTAAAAGLSVCLLDDNRTPGGQIWRGLSAPSSKNGPHSRKFGEWAERLRRSKCEVWPGWQAIEAPSTRTLRIERNSEVRDISYRSLILATGARERFLPFPGWTLPGVAGAGGLQALVKSGLDVRGKRIVVAGTGPLLLAVSAGLAKAGAEIVAIYEQAPMRSLVKFGLTLVGSPSKIGEGAGYLSELRGVPYRKGCWVRRAEGLHRLERLIATNGRTEWSHTCDWLACGFHLVPNLELPMLRGCAIDHGYAVVDEMQQSSVRGIACVGELTGIGGLEKALLEGEIAGWAAAGNQRKARELASRVKGMRRFAWRRDQAFALREELRTLPSSDTIVCRCEDVTYSAVHASRSWREAKLHTRCGMGPCQGRICGPQAEFLFGWSYTGSRPPIFPAKLSTLSASLQDTSSHEAAVDHTS
jgi:NADPH-dependent 2,4-dienoyl-CoA reductase/sulfur reductase-like enzyme